MCRPTAQTKGKEAELRRAALREAVAALPPQPRKELDDSYRAAKVRDAGVLMPPRTGWRPTCRAVCTGADVQHANGHPTRDGSCCIQSLEQ